MASRNSGSSAALRSAKDKAMAARLKAEGVTRKVCRCPLCHLVVGLSGLPLHIASCKGR